MLAAVVLGALAFVLRRRRTAGAFGGQYEPEADYYSNRVPRTPVPPRAAEAMPGLAAVDASGSPSGTDRTA